MCCCRFICHGLTTGETYVFRVRAVNAAGISDSSQESEAIEVKAAIGESLTPTSVVFHFKGYSRHKSQMSKFHFSDSTRHTSPPRLTHSSRHSGARATPTKPEAPPLHFSQEVGSGVVDLL